MMRKRSQSRGPHLIDRLNDPGRFWAFFPTTTTSLLSGILNAPWKTNEDRQNLLTGVFNNELLHAAAALWLSRALPRLSTEDDPARHLDALPRRPEAGDTPHSTLLRSLLGSKPSRPRGCARPGRQSP